MPRYKEDSRNEEVIRLIEIHIETENLQRSLEFYKSLLPHKNVIGSDNNDKVFIVLNDGSALGIWKKGTRGIHDGRGAKHLHFAFEISPDEFDEYMKRLESLKVEPLEYDWKDGNRSLYFFDPDGHQGEFMTKDWL